MATLSACAQTDDPITPVTPPDPSLGCEEATPRCLASCDGVAEVAEAVCESSRWTCAAGVNELLCCDPIERPEVCPLFASTCSAEQACPKGYTCVKSRTHPAPSESGLCRLGELEFPAGLATCTLGGATPAELIALAGPGPVKVNGLLVIDYRCDKGTCPPEEGCCQYCEGSYKLNLGPPAEQPDAPSVILPIRTEALSCAGTNCGLTCYPMQPGRRYYVWGTLIPAAVPGEQTTLYYLGHCPE